MWDRDWRFQASVAAHCAESSQHTPRLSCDEDGLCIHYTHVSRGEFFSPIKWQVIKSMFFRHGQLSPKVYGSLPKQRRSSVRLPYFIMHFKRYTFSAVWWWPSIQGSRGLSGIKRLQPLLVLCFVSIPVQIAPECLLTPFKAPKQCILAT